MKNVSLFIVSLFLGVCAVSVFAFSKNNTANNIISPLSATRFSLSEAPTESLRGSVTFSGNVSWESRTATQPSQLKKSRSIQQGEMLLAMEGGNALVNFPNLVNINIFPKTEIDFIQTLPDNMVFTEASGSAAFENTGQTPIAVKSLSLLTYVDHGKINITLDNTNDIVTIDVVSGSAKVAFNDLNYVSHVLSLSQGDTYVFDSDKRHGRIT